MRTYGLKRADRVICFKKNCSCGGYSSKHPQPKDVGRKGEAFNRISRSMKKRERRVKIEF